MIRKYKVAVVPAAPQQTAPTDPPDEFTLLLAGLKEKDFDQLTAFAKERTIDLGQTTSAGGAYKKIAAFLIAEKEKGGSTSGPNQPAGSEQNGGSGEQDQ